MAPIWVPEDRPPTNEEKAAIKKLALHFKGELDARRSQGTFHECLFGEVALTRVFRGNDADDEMSRKWLKRCLEKVKSHQLDSLIKEMSAKLDRTGTGTPLDKDLPGHEDVKEFVRAMFTAPELTPNGDLVNYISFVHFDMWKLMQELDWETWVSYVKGATLMRMIECERQSRKQHGRMVRVVTIMDVAGLSFSKLNCPAFHWKHSRDLASLQESVSAEIFGPVYVLNCPSRVQTLIQIFTKMLPARFSRKINLVEGDGLDDDEFVKLVGGRGQLKHMLALREALFNDGIRPKPIQRDITLTIGRGQDLVRSIDVQAGQRIDWEFQVKPGRDVQLGESDIQFSVSAYWTSEADPATYHRQVRKQLGAENSRTAIAENLCQRRIRVSDGRVSGGKTAASPGVIWLRWSNTHSRFRGKTLRLKITTEVVEEKDKPAQLASPNGDSSKSQVAALAVARQPSNVSNGGRSSSGQALQPRQASSKAPPLGEAKQSWACCMVRA